MSLSPLGVAQKPKYQQINKKIWLVIYCKNLRLQYGLDPTTQEITQGLIL